MLLVLMFLRKREILTINVCTETNWIALLNLSSWCLVMVERLFLMVPRGCLQFVIVVFPDHTHLLFLSRSFHIFLEPRSLARVHLTLHAYKCSAVSYCI